MLRSLLMTYVVMMAPEGDGGSAGAAAAAPAGASAISGADAGAPAAAAAAVDDKGGAAAAGTSLITDGNVDDKGGAAAAAAGKKDEPAAEPTPVDARAFLVEKGGKKEDVDKMSDADAVKAMKDAQAADKPIEYGTFKLPDGVKLDEKMDSTFKEFCGKHKVSPEDAQKMVDTYAAAASNMAKDAYNYVVEQWKTTQQTWRAEIAKDPVVGGPNLKANLGQIKDMVTEVAGKDASKVFQAMDVTGAGTEPSLVRFWYNLSKVFAEGKSQGGNPAGQSKPKAAAQVLYPNMQQETGN